MYKNVSLSASVMCMNWLNLNKQFIELDDEIIDFLHIDVIDGEVAPDFTMGSFIINLIRENSKKSFDYHLMVEEPSRLFDAFPIKKDDYYSIHQETSRNLHRDLISIKKLGCKVGVVLNPATSIETLEYILDDINMVTLMTVNPGYAGQNLVPQVLKKVEKVKNLIEKFESDCKISVDGNVSLKNIPNMIKAGANHLVLGTSSLFRKGINIKESIEEVKKSIDKGNNEL